MPVGYSPSSGKGRNDKKQQKNIGQKTNVVNQNGQLDKKRGRSPYNPTRKQKKTIKTTEVGDDQINISLGGPKQNEALNAEDKTLNLISQNVSDYSRQRMRALQMSLRNYSNVDGRISIKELNLACQDNSIQLHSRVMQILQQKFEDHRGINIEKLFQYLSEAHSRSGRDSVMAMQLRNDLAPHLDTNQEDKDADLLRRLEELLVKDNTYFDIETLREAFQLKDKQKTGKILTDEVFDIVALKQQPLYGALLKALVKRCDTDKNNIASWPEFLSFLEKAQTNAWDKYPDMSSLPELMRSKTPVVPDPMDSLTQHTKSKLVTKLLKKSSLNKVEKEAHSEEHEKDTPKNNIQKNLPQDKIHHLENGNEKLPDRETESDKKEEQQNEEGDPEDDKKRATLVKTQSGFLSSLKSFIAGRKNDDVASADGIELKDKDKVSEASLQNEAAGHGNETKSDKAEINIKITKADNVKKEEGKFIQPSNQADNKTNQKQEDESQKKLNDEKIKDDIAIPILKDSGGEEGESLVLVTHGATIKFQKPVGYDKQTVKLEPPEERLKLDWIYGYRGNDCRNNIHVLANGELVYFISNIVVLYDRPNHKQRHYKEHTEYIKCIALHGNGVTVATGQVISKHRPQNKPHIRVWRSDTLQTTQILEEFEKAVMCIAFSKSDDILAAVDNNSNKRLTVWNTSTGELLTEAEVNTELICDISFNKKYPDLLVTSGKEHLQWWKIYSESRTLQPVAQPQYDNYLKAKYIIYLAHNDKGDLVTGDSNGTIYIWADGGNKITNFVKHAHDGPVFVVMCYKNYILSGGRDGVVYCWVCNKNMDNAGHLQIPRSEGGIRMIQLHGDTLIIGTTMNSMLSSHLSNSNSPMTDIQLDPVPITQGHYDDLRGLVVMRESQLGGDFLTAGLDGVVCWFNTERRDPVCKLMLKGMQFTCADSSYDGANVVLGTRNGHLVILNIEGESSSEVFNNKVTTERINCVRFSPDYTSLAVGTHDHSIYMYRLEPKEDGMLGWELKGKCLGHNEPVVDIDFSAELYNDHFIIRSCSNKPDILYWDAHTLENIEYTNCKDVVWMTEKCKITPSNIGLWWSKLEQEGAISCVDVFTESNLIAMGDSCGNVCLYRYPCNRKGVT